MNFVEIAYEAMSTGDIILDLESYQVKMDLAKPNERIVRCNGLVKRRRSNSSKDGLDRMKLAKIEKMLCKSKRRIMTGNAIGLRVIVQNAIDGRNSLHCI